MIRQEIIERISNELDRAYSKHGREPWGRHEFYAILKEEVDELWDEIKCDSRQEYLIAEAIQVASMVFRYLETGDRYRDAVYTSEEKLSDWKKCAEDLAHDLEEYSEIKPKSLDAILARFKELKYQQK